MTDHPDLPADVVRLIQAEMNGTADAADRAALARAAANPAAAREIEGWRTVRALLRADGTETPPRPGLVEEIAAAARQGRGQVIVGPWRRVGSAAAAVLLAVAMFGLGRATAGGAQIVEAGPRAQVINDARLHAFLRETLGVSTEVADRVIETGKSYERRRRELEEGRKPEAAALDLAEREEKWRLLPPEARAKWRSIDPQVMPSEGEDK